MTNLGLLSSAPPLRAVALPVIPRLRQGHPDISTIESHLRLSTGPVPETMYTGMREISAQYPDCKCFWNKDRVRDVTCIDAGETFTPSSGDFPVPSDR
jgi:hypothetical protein